MKNIRDIAAAVVALLWAAPVLAVPLWNNIEVGMTFDQVKALYPELVPNPVKPGKMKRVAIYTGSYEINISNPQTGNCGNGPEVTVSFSRRVVNQITIHPYGCDLRSALISKFGAPTSIVGDTHKKDGVVLFGRRFTEDSTETTQIMTWIRDGVVVTYDGNKVVYDPSPSGTAGL